MIWNGLGRGPEFYLHATFASLAVNPENTYRPLKVKLYRSTGLNISSQYF
jgi:hypothetical protein